MLNVRTGSSLWFCAMAVISDESMPPERPISESEQFYQALKLRKIDTALVRIPDSSHAIVRRPSNMMRKVAHILKWFEMYREE